MLCRTVNKPQVPEHSSFDKTNRQSFSTLQFDIIRLRLRFRKKNSHSQHFIMTVGVHGGPKNNPLPNHQ